MKLADALDESGSRDASHERYRQAERLAATIDVERHVAVLNNLAYSEYSAGDYERAWEVVERMLTISEARGYDPDTTIMDTVSRVQVGLGHYAEGVMTAEAGIEMYDSQELTQADSLPEALLTLAIAQRHLGTTRDAERNLSTLKDAQKTLDRARAICEEHGFVRILVQIKQEQAELYAASGDYRKAFEAYKLYHAAEKDLVSMQRAARAHTRQAMFEAAEARQEAERFREQARRDPLTGLRNRRYVDEHLPGLLADAASTGGAVTVALVDLDHFKRINDTCSHDVGDQVLVAIAKMLEAVPPCDTGASGFAARMGGEEFLLVLNGMTPTAAVAKLEDLRASIAARSWQSLTGDLPVTVSIGVTASQPHSGQAELLNLADANLYTAKHKGRNRVCATSGAAPVPTPPATGGVTATPRSRRTPAEPGSPEPRGEALRCDGSGTSTRSTTMRVTLADPLALIPGFAQTHREQSARYPAAAPGWQPVHTVYVPADRFGAETPAQWGAAALELFTRHLAGPGDLAAVFGVDAHLADDVHARVAAKLRREPVEDLRVDFEDGYGVRPAEEDGHAARAAEAVAALHAAGALPAAGGCGSSRSPTATRAGACGRWTGS
nr:hypothetical protein GCM10020093_103230 [Planobispora longispora]